jgi:hypothetical protein
MNIPISEMTEAQAKKMLQMIVDKLDELDGEDYFGTEGWKHFFGLED